MKITERQAAIARMILEDGRHPDYVLFGPSVSMDDFVLTFEAFGVLGRNAKKCDFNHRRGLANATQLRTALAFIVTLGEDK